MAKDSLLSSPNLTYTFASQRNKSSKEGILVIKWEGGESKWAMTKLPLVVIKRERGRQRRTLT